MPTYDEKHLSRYGKAPPPERRTMEIETWNALLDRAIESIGQAKDEFVKEAEYHRAAVARDLAEVLQEMRS